MALALPSCCTPAFYRCLTRLCARIRGLANGRGQNAVSYQQFPPGVTEKHTATISGNSGFPARFLLRDDRLRRVVLRDFDTGARAHASRIDIHPSSTGEGVGLSSEISPRPRAPRSFPSRSRDAQPDRGSRLVAGAEGHWSRPAPHRRRTVQEGGGPSSQGLHINFYARPVVMGTLPSRIASMPTFLVAPPAHSFRKPPE